MSFLSSMDKNEFKIEYFTNEMKNKKKHLYVLYGINKIASFFAYLVCCSCELTFEHESLHHNLLQAKDSQLSFWLRSYTKPCKPLVCKES